MTLDKINNGEGGGDVREKINNNFDKVSPHINHIFDKDVEGDLYSIFNPSDLTYSGGVFSHSADSQTYLRFLPETDSRSGWTLAARVTVSNYVSGGDNFGVFLAGSSAVGGVNGNGTFDFSVAIAGSITEGSTVVGLGTFGTPSETEEFDWAINKWLLIPTSLYDSKMLDESNSEDSVSYAVKAYELLNPQELSADSFGEISALANKVYDDFTDDIVDYNLFIGADVSHVKSVTNNVLQIDSELSPSAGNPYVHRFGMRVKPANYAADNKLYTVVLKGTLTATNAKNLLIKTGARSFIKYIVEGDLVDSQEYSFELTLNISYEAGYSGLNEYIWLEQEEINDAVNQTLDFDITHFAIFETVSNWELADYIVNHIKTINYPLFFPENVILREEFEQTKNRILKSNIADQYTQEFSSDVAMIIMYGQSLSVGNGGADDNSDYRNILSFPGGCNEWDEDVDIDNASSVSSFYGSDLVFLSSISGDKPPIAAAAIAWLQSLEDENEIDFTDFDYQFLLSSPGESGRPIDQLNQGTSYYDRLLFSVSKGKELAIKSGKSFEVPCLFWVQGESDLNDTQAAYYTLLAQLFIDLNTDIKAITGQSDDVKFVTYQTSPLYNTAGYTNSGPSFAQVQLAREVNNVYGALAMYQFEYGDTLHPSDRAVIGMQLGIYAKRLVNGDEAKPVFYPRSHKVYSDNGNYVLSVEFDVPYAPMRFDISGDKTHNLNGKQTNYGFRLLNGSDTNIISSEPVIKRGNTLVIECTEDPTGAKLSYATDGHFGGGNLCDSMNALIRNKGEIYTLDNFAVSFLDYVI